MERETKIEQGDWGSLVFSRNVWKYSAPKESDWNMITDRREDWWGFNNIHHHPDSPLKYIEGCIQNATEIVCPYCGNAHEPETEDHFLEGGEAHCYECEREYIVESSFGYGFSTKPKPCKHHHWVFEAQYAHYDEESNYGWSTWRNMVCINCGNDNNSRWPMSKYEKTNGVWSYNRNGQKIFTLLPWLDEYNDPDFFDPEGILKTGADLTEEYETPILDFLRGRKSWYGWGKAKIAIIKHEQIYGDL